MRFGCHDRVLGGGIRRVEYMRMGRLVFMVASASLDA